MRKVSCFRFILICLFYLTYFKIQSQSPFANYNHWIAIGDVYCLAQDSLYVYAGGNFNYVGPPTGSGAKLTSINANPDLTFCRPDGAIECVISDGAGGWYIGGYFTSITTSDSTAIVRNRIAHILSNGKLDMTWDPNSNGAVLSLSYSGNEIFVGGAFTNIGGQSRNYIAKLSTTGTGTADPVWHPNADGNINCLAFSGSDLYVGGMFTSIGGLNRNYIAKLNPNSTGAADVTWDANADADIYSMVLSGVDLYVGGTFTNIGGQNRNYIAKLSTTGFGIADFTWNPNANNQVNALALSGGDIFVGGNFTNIGGQNRNNIAKLSASGTGSADVTWNPNADNNVYSLAISGADLYVGGLFLTINSQPRYRIARLSITGTGIVDPAWNPNSGNGIVRSIAVSGSNVYVGGNFVSFGGYNINALARFSKITGTADLTWNPSPNGNVWGMAVSGSDLYVGGLFSQVNSVPRNNIAKLSTTNGSVDATWNPNANNQVYSLVVNGSDVFVGGTYTSIGGQSRNRLAKLSTTGTGAAEPTWNPNVYTNTGGSVRTLALSAGDLYVGGIFTNIGGQARNNIAKVASTGTGSADATWNADADNVIYSLALSGNDLYACGGFTNIGGQNRNRIAKLSSTGTGSVDVMWDPNANSTVYSLVVNGNTVFACGAFTSIGGQNRNYIAKLSTSGIGTADVNWDPNANSTILDLSLSNTNLYLGGFFSNIGGIGPRNGLALLGDLCVPTIPILNVSNDSICSGQSISLNVLSGSLNSATNWLWYNSSCGTGFVGSGPTINDSPNATTIYYVRGEGGCADSSAICATITVNVFNCTGNQTLEDKSTATVTVYPNPASLNVTIELEENNESSPFELVNAEGQTLFSGIITSKVTFNVNHFRSGLYCVKVTTGNGVIRKKLIID